MGRGDRGGAGRRGGGGHERVLVVAHDGHHPGPPAPLLRRGQRLRHLGAGRPADPGRGHRGQPRLLRQPLHPERRRHRARRGRPALRRDDRPRPGGPRARPAAAHGAAALGPLGPGHPGLQAARADRAGAGQRPADQAARPPGARHPLRRRLGGPGAGGGRRRAARAGRGDGPAPARPRGRPAPRLPGAPERRLPRPAAVGGRHGGGPHPPGSTCSPPSGAPWSTNSG